MRGFRVVIICVLILTWGVDYLTGQASSPVLQAMSAELNRSMEKLKTQPVPPYFLSYEIVDSHQVNVSGAFGKLTGSHETRHRQLDIDLRVGDYTVDNTREIRGGVRFGSFGNFKKVKTNVQVKVAREDQSNDFSREEPPQFSEPITDIKVDRAAWEDKVRKYTAPFAVPSLLFEDVTVRKVRGETSKPPVAPHPYFDHE